VVLYGGASGGVTETAALGGTLVFGAGLASAGRAIAAAAQQLRAGETPPDGIGRADATTFARAEVWKGTP
jgi:hypothetical protein